MDLVQSVRESGIVGAGGAGFPTHVKLDSRPEYIILNAAECEPLLCTDQHLIKYYTDGIISGLEAVLKSTGAKKAYIGIKGKHREAVQILETALGGVEDIELFILEDFYPAGDEQVLVYEVTKRVVPEGGIPIKVGCLVINVETVLNIYNALSGKPVTHTCLTIAGDVPKPVTVMLPVGMLISEALKIAGLDDAGSKTVIDGGPMMGRITSKELPVTKTTKGLVVLDSGHPLVRKKKVDIKQALRQSRAACLQCRMCTEMCPRYLLGHNMEPHMMMRKSNYGDSIEGAPAAFLCSECSVCELYTCPSGLSPRLINISFKKKLIESSIRYKTDRTEFSAKSFRDYRKIPVDRLILRLGLSVYNVEAPMDFGDYVPDVVKIPLKQHSGAPAVPVVKAGQSVRAGDLIGEIPEGSLGARVHASIDGVVREVSNYVVIERA